MVDNLDSFTFNLIHYFEILGCEVQMVKAHTAKVSDCLNASPSWVVFSPGPGHPKDASFMLEVMQAFIGKVPLFGVCLGMQALNLLLGGKVVRAKAPMHGKFSKIFHEGKGIFKNLPNGFKAIRYHSLMVDKTTLPDSLEITAWTEDGVIMGIRAKNYDFEGVQFHPESILTEQSFPLLSNFLRLRK